MNNGNYLRDIDDRSTPKSSIGLFLSGTILLLMTIAPNPDWNSSILWWGSIGLFLVAFLYNSKGSILVEKAYATWWGTFLLLCTISYVWAVKPALVWDQLKSMFVTTILLFVLRSTAKSRADVEKILKILILSIGINAVYLILTNLDMLASTSVSELGEVRLGTEGDWNANGIGLMTSTGMLVALFFMSKKNISNFRRLLYVLGVAFLLFVTMVTGSRTAILKAVLGVILFIYLSSKGKRVRAVLFLALLVAILYYLVMEVPFFYAIIGWRLDGLWALITGTGTVDHSADIRSRFIEDAFEKWKTRPVFGYGINCYRAVNTVKYNYYAHNNFVELLADLGFVGFVVYYAGFLWSGIKLLVSKGDNMKWLFFSFLVAILLSDYGTVSYATLFTQLLVMLMFSYIEVSRRETGESALL